MSGGVRHMFAKRAVVPMSTSWWGGTTTDPIETIPWDCWRKLESGRGAGGLGIFVWLDEVSRRVRVPSACERLLMYHGHGHARLWCGGRAQRRDTSQAKYVCYPT